MTRMLSKAELLALLPEAERKAELASLTNEAKAHLFRSWTFWGRPEQFAPEGDWTTWLILAGRGWGKTRTGAEWVKQQVEAGCKRIALIAETQKDLEQVMVEGDSGLLSIFPPDERPEYKKKPVEITFANGAKALGYNGTEPDQLRGPQFDAAWCDELAKWRYARETWDMLQFGLRLGDDPRQCVTTTPRAIPLIKQLMADPATVVTRGRTLDNSGNLAASFIKAVHDKYAGTRLGRQELNAEVLDDIPGAIWLREWIDRDRKVNAPELTRKVVAVDPAITSDETSDEPGTHGIASAALGADGRGYVLGDYSMQGTPREWATEVVRVFDQEEADQVVVEINQGGDMVESTLRSVRPSLPIRKVRASRGKHIRAEPVASLYEQGRVSHVGAFSELEDQMCLFTNEGYQGEGSPDRTDALVWALTELFQGIIHHTEPEKPRDTKRDDYEIDGEDDDMMNYKVA